MFEIKPGDGFAGHTQLNVAAHDLTLDQCRAVQSVVCNQWSLSEDYKLKIPAHPFLQGYEEPREGRSDGWVFVEFWTNDRESIQKFVDHLNKRVFG